MTNPITTMCGHTFDKTSMEAHLAAAPTVYRGYGPQEYLCREAVCPTCRAPIPHDWIPVINYDLKAIIEQAVAQAYPITTPQPSVEVKTLPINVTAGRILTTTDSQTLHVCLTVADDPAGCIPLDVCKILDISGSMAGRATAPKKLMPGDCEEVTTLLSRNDCSTHATRALVGALKETDRLAILGFDTTVMTYLPLTRMNMRGKMTANATIDTIRPRGGTSFWAGIKAALTQLKENYNPANNSVIIFNTDGESDASYNPIGMTIPDAIAAWKEANPTIKFTLHTVGYGYGDSLQMDLLSEIAEVGGGSVVYVPDGDMLAQNMIHLFANLSTCTHTNVMVKAGSSQTLVRFLQGQRHNLILKVPTSVDTVTVTCGSQVVTVAIDEEMPEEAADALARDFFVTNLTTSLHTKHMDVAAIAAKLSSFGDTAFIRGIIMDLTHPDKYKGQIGKAFNPANFERWGNYYLGGVLSGHRNQWTVNFKDEGGKTYGGTTTRRAISNGVDVYDNLPPIRPSFMSASGIAPATVAPSSQGSGPCFTAETLVLMYDGSTKRMDQIRYGDKLLHGFDVRCVIRTRVTMIQQIVRFGVAGITEFHPIIHNGTWVHPRSIGPVENIELPFIYNLILENGHMISLPLAKDSTEVTVACTMAHNFEGPVISHPYFGKRVAGLRNCIDDFQLHAGWDAGYICIKNVQEYRDASNEIVQLKAEDDTF